MNAFQGLDDADFDWNAYHLRALAGIDAARAKAKRCPTHPFAWEGECCFAATPEGRAFGGEMHASQVHGRACFWCGERIVPGQRWRRIRERRAWSQVEETQYVHAGCRTSGVGWRA